jgi:hypothetical protein
MRCPSATPRYGNAPWRMCKGRRRSLWKSGTCTPHQICAHRPWLMPRRTARTYANSGSTSYHPRRFTPDAAPSLMLFSCGRHVGMRPSRPAGHYRGHPRPSTLRTGQPKHCRRLDALVQPARTCGPPAAGTPLQHADIGGPCRRPVGGKFCITSPTRGLLPSHWGRLTAAKPLNPPAARVSTPGGSQCHSCTAPRPSTRRAAPPGARPALTQLRCM